MNDGDRYQPTAPDAGGPVAGVTRPDGLDATAGELADRLVLDERAHGWLTELAAADPAPGPARLPDDAAATALLARMRVPAEDVAPTLAARPDADRHPELWWLLERCRWLLVERFGDPGPAAPWPNLPDALGAPGRFFYLWVFLATTPDLLDYHARHGIAEQVSSDTLADIGSKTALRRRTRGEPGLDKQTWFTLHFRGLLYALGRLQFNVARAWRPVGPLAVGDAGLDTHIPEAGPMTAAACDASFAAAPDFFARHFGTRYPVATCSSWLLDDQLAEDLPASSNIVRFQRRFTLLDGGYPADASIVEFVFRRIDPDLATLPQDTTLQRAVVRRLRAGGHWQARTGWLAL